MAKASTSSIGGNSSLNNNKQQKQSRIPRQRIRQRIPKSCLPCLSGKRACDRAKPVCSRCERTFHQCVYADEPLPEPRMARLPPSSSSSELIRKRSNSTINRVKQEEGFSEAESEEEEEDVEDLSGTSTESIERQTKRIKRVSNGAISPVAVASSSKFQSSQPSSNAISTFASPSNGTLFHNNNSNNKMFDPSSSTDSDVHKAGQALVNLQGSTPWSTGSMDASSSPSTQQHLPAGGSTPSNVGYVARRNLIRGASSTAAHPGGGGSSGMIPSTGGIHGSHTIPGTDLRSNSSTSSASPSSRMTDATGGAGSHVNLNGIPLWHGETVTGTSVFNQVPPSNDGQPEDLREASEMPTNIQNAFNGLLYPITDSFPFETFWSSGANFKQDVLPLFPTAKEGKGILDSFKKFVRIAGPGLLDSNILAPAQDFLCNRSEREREMISLPWMASFMMIVVIGRESRRTCGPSEDEEFDSDENEDEDKFSPVEPSKSAAPASSSDQTSSNPKTTRESNKRKLSNKSSSADIRKHLDRLLSATYQALRLCSFLGSPNLQTIYAQLLIGMYLLHTERVANAWPILGSITRQAQSIGLHVEPSNIKGNLTLEERELRRKLWWTIVQQDVLLSSIFGRPLAVSRFTCRIHQMANNLERIERQPTYQEILCEFSIYARRHLNEDQELEWNENELKHFKDDLLKWYYGLPSQMMILKPFEEEEEYESNLMQHKHSTEKQALRDQLSRLNSTTIQHAVDLNLQIQFALLSLYRNRLSTAARSPSDGLPRQQQQNSASQSLNEASLRECGQAVHRITMALATLIDLLGSLQAGMVWVRVFYAFHAGVTAAFLALSKPTSFIGIRAREDLKTLTDVCQRLPDRFDGLKTVKATFGVLSKLVQVMPKDHSHRRNFGTPIVSRTGSPSRGFGPPYATPVKGGENVPVSGDGSFTHHLGGESRFTSGSGVVHGGGEGDVSSSGIVNTPQKFSLHPGSALSPLRIDELLAVNDIGLPAFNLSRDPPISGTAPIFDQMYVGEPSQTPHGHSNNQHSNETIHQSSLTHGTPSMGGGNVQTGGGGGGGLMMASSLSSYTNPSVYEMGGTGISGGGGGGEQQPTGNPTNVLQGQSSIANLSGQGSNSRMDRGFPEPFGPMIAPPGPDASTDEIVHFWREFFALPFQASDLGLS